RGRASSGEERPGGRVVVHDVDLRQPGPRVGFDRHVEDALELRGLLRRGLGRARVRELAEAEPDRVAVTMEVVAAAVLPGFAEVEVEVAGAAYERGVEPEALRATARVRELRREPTARSFGRAERVRVSWP